MFKKILIASDGSADSIKAAEKAIELAKVHQEEGTLVEVVYVVDGNTSKYDVLRNWDSLGIKEERKEKLRAVEQKAFKARVDYSLKILRGEPGSTIVKYADENNIDLIVIGNRGLNTLQEMVMGSVSHKVIQKAHCPVLIVK
ncbi:universal stress protein (plasmid) [Pseudalkalibacillus hwajinpoensis]|uniref:universal stress protein n=1 Tax=Guptibacillus hwajinpoensis TaxID=208199 RepID=UPI00325A713E